MAGFLGLEDLTNSRGELALVVQTDKKNFSIEAVASLPDTSISSVQDAYLSASLSSVLPVFPRHKGQSEQHYKRQNPSVLEPFVSSFSEKSTQLSPLTRLPQPRRSKGTIFRFSTAISTLVLWPPIFFIVVFIIDHACLGF